MRQVIVVQLATGQQRLDHLQACCRAIAHGQRHGAVELDHRRGCGAQQYVVQADDLYPVGCRHARRLGMHRGDGRLQAVGAEAPRLQRGQHQRLAFADQTAIPQVAVLFFQQNRLAGGRSARAAARLMQQHQRQQALHFRLRQQLEQQAAKTDGLDAQVLAGQLDTGAGEITFVEHQVDHLQHRLQTLRQLVASRHFIGDVRIADLVLRPHDALGDGAGRGEEGAGDFLGSQVTDFAQGQCHLSLDRQGRVAAGEDQAQAVVLQMLAIPDLALGERFGAVLQGLEARLTAQLIDSFEAPSGDQPSAWIGRHALNRPLLQSGTKGLMQGLFGQVEIAEQANQGCQHPP